MIYEIVKKFQTINSIIENATKSCRYFVLGTYIPDDLPEKGECFIDIKVEPQQRKQIEITYYNSSNSYKRDWIPFRWLGDWQKKLTSNDMLSQNIVEFHAREDFVEGYISYVIKNNVCYVSLRELNIRIPGLARSLTINMPLPKDGVYISFVDHFNGELIGLAYINRNDPVLKIHGYKVGVGYVSFSYVIQ